MRAKSGTVLRRPDLGEQVMSYIEDSTSGYIGLEIFPVKTVASSHGIYPVIPADVLLGRMEDVRRAPRGAYNRSDWEYERGRYTTTERGHEEPMDDVEWKQLEQEAPGLAESISIKRAMDIILRSQEKRIADKLFNESNFTAHNASVKWTTAATATPVDDVLAGKTAFRAQCGMLPDALVITYDTFLALRRCTQIRDQLKYTFPGIDLNRLSVDQLCAILDVPRIIVAGALYNSAGKGFDPAISSIWNSAYGALVKISTGADLSVPGIGRTFVWSEDSSVNPIVEQYREEQTRSEIFRVRHHVEENFIRSVNEDGSIKSNIAAKCCYLFGNLA